MYSTAKVFVSSRRFSCVEYEGTDPNLISLKMSATAAKMWAMRKGLLSSQLSTTAIVEANGGT